MQTSSSAPASSLIPTIDEDMIQAAEAASKSSYAAELTPEEEILRVIRETDALRRPAVQAATESKTPKSAPERANEEDIIKKTLSNPPGPAAMNDSPAIPIILASTPFPASAPKSQKLVQTPDPAGTPARLPEVAASGFEQATSEFTSDPLGITLEGTNAVHLKLKGTQTAVLIQKREGCIYIQIPEYAEFRVPLGKAPSKAA